MQTQIRPAPHKVTTKHHLPWLLGIILLPFLMAATIVFSLVGSLVMALMMIPLALMGKLTLTITRG